MIVSSSRSKKQNDNRYDQAERNPLPALLRRYERNVATSVSTSHLPPRKTPRLYYSSSAMTVSPQVEFLGMRYPQTSAVGHHSEN